MAFCKHCRFEIPDDDVVLRYRDGSGEVCCIRCVASKSGLPAEPGLGRLAREQIDEALRGSVS